LCQRLVRALCTTSFAFVLVASAQLPDPAITIVLTDHHFRLSAPVEAGRLQWHVKNEGSEPHQALVIGLPEGISEFGEEAWFEHGSKGPEPGQRVGGLDTLAPGAEGSFTTDLRPGRYLLLCAMAEDEGRHYELGMIYRFTIE
jgi:uncharacterized cupredoxin-like copper-binding protein